MQICGYVLWSVRLVSLIDWFGFWRFIILTGGLDLRFLRILCLGWIKKFVLLLVVHTLGVVGVKCEVSYE